MPLEYRFTCRLPNGVHARPASALEAVTRDLPSATTLFNERTGQSADARSVLGIVGLDIRLGDPCRIVVSGADEARSLDVLRGFLDAAFPLLDAPLPPRARPSARAALPPLLRLARPSYWSGTPAVGGIGRGTAVAWRGSTVPSSVSMDGPDDVEAEIARVDAAIEAVTAAYDALLASPGDKARALPSIASLPRARALNPLATVEACGIVSAHRSIVRDPEFRERIHAQIRQGRRTAAGAIADAESYFSAMLMAAGSELLHERALDVKDVCRFLLASLLGHDAWTNCQPDLPLEGICLADVLTPGQLLSIDRSRLRGLVLTRGGTTSHTVVLARSFGIPTVVGVDDLDADAVTGMEVIVDGELGLVALLDSAAVRRYYEMEAKRLQARRCRQMKVAAEPGVTSDGHRIEIAANISCAEEAAAAFDGGADAIGMFRTEMLFAGRALPPEEDEQFEQYRQVVALARGRPVIIRTLDAGGDKNLPWLGLEREDNPFLGRRGVRLYPDFSEVFRAQARALLRASASGRLKIIVPMVACVEEARWVRKVVDEERAGLARRGVAVGEDVEVGIMLEVPSAAFLVKELSEAVDFFSIGSNDLLQYFVAADRGNAGVRSLYDPLNPGFVRFLAKIATEARASGRWVGLCGEMGGDPRYLPLLVGLGFDEISMAAPSVPEVKGALGQLSAARCRELAGELAASASTAEVKAKLESFTARQELPLVHPDLVVFDRECRTREEAAKLLADRLYVAGRTVRPRDIEEAIAAREAVYSTGFGHGFAIPHCRTDALVADSLAVARLSEPVPWDSLDGEPVHTVIFLGIRESSEAVGAHMRVLAALARRLMHDEFRDALRSAPDEAALCEVLASGLS
ncbi:MAG: phosphoenolpyruvate--protein phosphotransferase [Vicinamibacterales bacterium]